MKDLIVNEPVDVAYPDDGASGVLIKFGAKVDGGVGPDGDIVGFSTVCPHKGFPLTYSPTEKTFNCPGHYSVFDPERGGQQVWGQSTQNLPQYVLRVDENGDIFAEGVDELIYGRLSNVI
nr:AoxA [Sinorhizobium sp. GW3]